MPELPEVECVRLSLNRFLPGQTLAALRCHHPKVLISSHISEKDLFPLAVDKLGRQGKYLIIHLERGFRLIVHFRMTGSFYYRCLDEQPAAHTHIEFALASDRILSFRDPRRFGRIWLVGENEESPLDGLGPDALDVPEDLFTARLLQRKRQIKPLLLDQAVLAGLGNIYVDESLFRARIHPGTRSHTLRRKKISELWKHTQEVLQQAIARGGSSIADFVDPEGFHGTYQEAHGVYGRQGLPCPRCGTTLKRIVVAQRGTHICPRCQKPER